MIHLGVRIYFRIKTVCVELKDMFRRVAYRCSGCGNSIVNKGMSRYLIETYGGDLGQNVNFSNYSLGFGLIHYSLIKNIRPKKILCVGSREGFIPAILASACKDNRTGRVYFVDAGYGRSDIGKHWSGLGFWKSGDPFKHFSKIGVNKYITTYVMTTKEFWQKHAHKYDYIYIDGDHSYEGVKLDYNLFWPRLNKNGLMLFHDVSVKYTKELGSFGVWKFWKSLNNKRKITLPYGQNSGLGIIQK